ncbi:MAG TPA: hypothetical protein VKY73_01370 [Polyangiaceae bacterium]|nr:hypothetical protein [Polyangiaceae bacterium]
MRRACVLAAALLTLGCDREPKRPAGATASSVSARPLAAPTPPPPEPVVVERATACRLLRVSGDVRAEGGAALAERAVLDGATWVTLGEKGRAVVVHARSGREITVVGPGRFLPCRGGAEQFLVTEGKLESSAGTGVRPGAEVWIATPFGTLRYGDAALVADVRERELRVEVARGALAAELAPGVRGFPAKGLSGPNARAVLTGKPDPAALVEACAAAAREASESATRLLAAKSGPPLGSEAARQLTLRRRARSLCASADASLARVDDPAVRSRLGDQLALAEQRWQTISSSAIPGSPGSAR